VTDRLYLEISVWSQVVSSIVFIGVLVYAWQRWLMPVFLAAQTRSNQQIAEAERHRSEAKAALDLLREEIHTASHDAELIAQRAQRQAEHERQAAIAEANEAGKRVLEDANKELQRARAAAVLNLRAELVAQALRVAREDATLRVGAAVDARVIEGFIGSLEGSVHG
jgi:F0F1-type ATP synthase membrane subunit b/b'